MWKSIDDNQRGGISMIVKKYAKANNKFLPDYDPSQPSSFIMYLDANNLYGWAMSQPLPISNFQWLRKGIQFSRIGIIVQDGISPGKRRVIKWRTCPRIRKWGYLSGAISIILSRFMINTMITHLLQNGSL